MWRRLCQNVSAGPLWYSYGDMTRYRGHADKDQLAFVFTFDRESLEEALRDMTGRSISLTVTDNSTSVLSVRSCSRGFRVRLHRVFLDAGAEVIREVAGFITGGVRKTPLIRQHIRAWSEALSQKQPRSRKLRSAGRCYDLGDIYHRLNSEYFGGALNSAIGWGVRSSRRAVKRRILGSYCRRTNTIRINPVMDSSKVPSYFVEFVVYHEMLHADMGAVKIGGRLCVHTREFRERERRFGQYEKAIRWEREGYPVR